MKFQIIPDNIGQKVLLKDCCEGQSLAVLATCLLLRTAELLYFLSSAMRSRTVRLGLVYVFGADGDLYVPS